MAKKSPDGEVPQGEVEIVKNSKEMSPRSKKVFEALEKEHEEGYDPIEQKKKEELLLRFRNQIEKPYWSDNIYMELNIENLKQYYIRSIKDLEDIKDFYKISPATEREVLTIISKKGKRSDLRIQFEEKCYLTKLTQEEIELYFQLLQQRIDDIEQVIDLHFDTIKKAIFQDKSDKIMRQQKKDREEQRKMFKGQSEGTKSHHHHSSDEESVNGEEDDLNKQILREKLMGDPDLQFENPQIFTYMKKLDQLYEYEETLLLVDKNKKENRRGLQTICRMVGSLSQSYFLWDAQQNKIARDIYYELENEEEVKVENNDSDLEDIYNSMQSKQQKEAQRLKK